MYTRRFTTHVRHAADNTDGAQAVTEGMYNYLCVMFVLYKSGPRARRFTTHVCHVAGKKTPSPAELEGMYIPHICLSYASPYMITHI